MRALSIPWPKLLGSILLLESAGLILAQAPFWRGHLGPVRIPGSAWEWWYLAFTIIFCFTSYSLYRGRDWARLTIIVMSACFASLFIWSRVNGSIAAWQQFNPSSNLYPFRTWESVADDLGTGLSLFLAPMAFITLTLCHRDVVATFRRGIDERSNRALEATAGRRVKPL